MVVFDGPEGSMLSAHDLALQQVKRDLQRDLQRDL